MEKIKVVWLCSFTNSEVAKRIASTPFPSVAPWITELIHLFRNGNEIDLSIVSPNYYNNKNQYFKIDDIKFFLYKYNPFYLPKRAYNFAYNYNKIQRLVSDIINSVKPDLIHLYGSENPLYSVGILPLLNKYPVLVTIQGFVSLSSKPKNFIQRYIRWNRIRIERKINSNALFFTCASNDVSKCLKAFTSKAECFEFHYPTTIPEFISNDFQDKRYDIVYYAAISKEKGIEDLLKAIRIIKMTRPSIKAIVIGGGNCSYVSYIRSVISDFGLNENIFLAGFQSTQQEAFKLAVQARVYVLPTHFDGLPGSLREAMFMKLPVVSYAVGGIPELNSDKESVTLVENQNIDELVEKIQLVLDNRERTDRLVNNAYEVITSKYDNGKIYANLLNIYTDIIGRKENKCGISI
jgi:glycosyltransferase involved in cell wall biosynthesis